MCICLCVRVCHCVCLIIIICLNQNSAHYIAQQKEISCQNGRGAEVAWIMSLPTAGTVRVVQGVLYVIWGGYTGNCVKPFRR